jgi:hypothetical protein
VSGCLKITYFIIGVPIVMELGEAANGRKVVGRTLDDVLELNQRLVVPAQVEQRPAERHSCRDVIRELPQPVSTEADSPFEIAGPSEPFRNGTEGRRILDSSSWLAGAIDSDRHGRIRYLICTVSEVVSVRPVLSVTTSVTV